MTVWTSIGTTEITYIFIISTVFLLPFFLDEVHMKQTVALAPGWIGLEITTLGPIVAVTTQRSHISSASPNLYYTLYYDVAG